MVRIDFEKLESKTWKDYVRYTLKFFIAIAFFATIFYGFFVATEIKQGVDYSLEPFEPPTMEGGECVQLNTTEYLAYECKPIWNISGHEVKPPFSGMRVTYRHPRYGEYINSN